MAHFDTKEIVIGGTEWKTAPFRFSKMFTLSGGSGPSYIDVLLSGVSPLALTNTLGLNYIKALGKCEQNGTPTPDTPVDIICNNGVVKAFKTLNISTYDISPNDAGIDITFDGATDRRKWNTLNDGGTGTKHYENGFVSIYMSANGNTYYVKALVDGVVYNGSVYNTEKQIDSWSFTTVKNIDIYCPTINTDGTQETVNITGKNLISGNYSQFNSQGGTGTTYGYFKLPDENSTYTISLKAKNDYTCPANVSIGFTKNGGNASNGVLWAIRGGDSVVAGDVITKTNIGSGSVKYPFVSIYINSAQTLSALTENFDIQIEQGSTATAYEPYFDGGTANAEMLLKVGDYKDEQELLTGNVTRNVGIMVLDGTENWVKISNTDLCYLDDIVIASLPNICLSTHFIGEQSSISAGNMRNNSIKCGGTNVSNRLFVKIDAYNSTVQDFKQFLADQYNAGTPVIVVYPLATPTTETVTGQSLTASGNCTVTATGSLDNLELELSYKQSI